MTARRRRVGVFGAGQLGWMMAQASGVDVDCLFLDPAGDSSAARLAPFTRAGFDDLDAAQAFAESVDVVTYESEAVPAATMRALCDIVEVAPNPAALADAQDREREKALFARLGIPAAANASARTFVNFERVVAELGLPVFVKSRTSGYDGRGQVLIQPGDSLREAWDMMGAAAGVVVESVVKFERELSIIAARSRGGDVAFYPVVENHHRDGILYYSVAPAPALDPTKAERARQYAAAILDHYDYVGVVTIEMFEVGDDLLANEMAPRVHNSGHWTIEGARTSQFENHLRAVAGAPLGPVDMTAAHAGLVNVIGSPLAPDALEAAVGAVEYRYPKAPRPGRKIGHVSFLADSPAELRDKLTAVQAVAV